MKIMNKKLKIKCAIFLPSLIVERSSEYHFYNKLLKQNYIQITCIYLINEEKRSYKDETEPSNAVSYTHLKLPTILRV